MPTYDFKQLSPNDFEQLSRDLIQKRDCIILEFFKAGRDQGIDLRFAQASNNTIVQCKHYAGTGYSGLMTDLKKEAVKATKLNPTRYILATSVGLTPANKSEIQVLFGAILTTGDILGSDDLNNLLGLHPEIEQQHYKLWLASRAVLDRVIHNASLIQSDFDVARVHSDIHRYVQSTAYPRACAMLKNGHVAIISGAPGVGKTSLAKMLLYTNIMHGFEVISILTDFQTGRDRYQHGKKQIFYFDDFIGATFLGERASAFTRNEDRAILDFIEMVRSSPTARLVMTTREHILNQAIATSEKLKQSNLIDNRCVLEIGDYSNLQRANILYNHIYFSDLPDEYRAALLAGRFYMAIVKHRKFNPRLIEWLSNFQRVKSVAPDRYQSFVRDLLADPSEIWRHAYEQQISDAARSALLALYSFGGKCRANTLEQAFRALHLLRAANYNFKTEPSDWRRALNELNGSFIRPGNEIEVIDPSVLDMLNSVVRLDPPNAVDMIEGAFRFEQARHIWAIALSNGAEIRHHLAIESMRVATAFDRLLHQGMQRISAGCTTALSDDTIELQVGTVIQVAEMLQSNHLSKVAETAIDSLFRAWEEETINLIDGIALLDMISASTIDFRLSKNEVREKIIRTLVIGASSGCLSEELHQVLNAIENEGLNSELTNLLFTAAEENRDQYFPGELAQCSSQHEYQALEDALTTIAERTGVDLEGPIHAVVEAKAEFEAQESEYEERHYDEWKEQHYEYQENDRELDNLFDSLRR